MPDFSHSDPTWQARLEPVFRLYAALLRGVEPEGGLGGRLLYAGELHEDGCRLVRAANIAGAASVSATGDLPVHRHANRDGVADFLVTSLDEALRIIKNEIRKGQTVSVSVSAAPAQVVAEMRERGVLPDLLPPATWNESSSDLSEFLANGARRIEMEPLPDGWAFLAWSPVPRDFDALASAVLPEEDHLNRRWLRLAPRYLGPGARRVCSLACAPENAARLAEVLAARPP